MTTLTKIVVTPEGQQEVALTDAEIAQYNADQTVAAQQTIIATWLAYQATAQAALDESDMVASRCFKADVAFPSAWQTYVQSLRVIMSASTGDATQPLPTKPAYPAGT